MIRYDLKCDQGHSFDSWFASAGAFETVQKAGQLCCPVCGSTEVKKALMAPGVSTAEAPSAPVLANPSSEMEAAMRALRKQVEENSDYVGTKFASEARAMHLGDKPERAIYGEAKAEEAKALVEEGVPLMPLPFAPKKKLS